MKPRSAKKNLRLFVALELPDRVREGLEAWQRAELGPIPVLRSVHAGGLHLTLAFLGERPARDAERIDAILERTRSAAPRLRLQAEPVAIPEGRPRLFAIEAESEAAVVLQGEVSAALAAERLYRPGGDAFWPHVTIARTRALHERRGSKRPARVDVRPRALPEALLEPFFCRRLRLYRSKLRPQGAEYVPLTSTDLKVSN